MDNLSLKQRSQINQYLESQFSRNSLSTVLDKMDINVRSITNNNVSMDGEVSAQGSQ